MRRVPLALATFALLALAACGTAAPTVVTQQPGMTPTSGITPTSVPSRAAAAATGTVSVPTVPPNAGVNPTMNPTEKILYATIAARPVSTQPPTPTPISVTPIVIEGSPSVVLYTSGYGKTEYHPTVIFRVKNPNPDITALAVPFRVTIKGGGNVLFTSDGKDTIDVPAGETRPVLFQVYNTDSDVRPDAAEVRLYPAPPMYKKTQDMTTQTDWSITNSNIDCTSAYTQCGLQADVQWNGQGTRARVRVLVVTHRGTDTSGPIVAVGLGEMPQDTLVSGQVTPMVARLTGFDQPQPDSKAVLPSGPITHEFYVESIAQR